MKLNEAIRSAAWSDTRDKGRAELFAVRLGNKAVTAVSQEDIDAFHARMGHCPQTINRWRPVLKKLGLSPKRVREHPHHPRVLTASELADMDAKVRDHDDKLCACIYGILRDTGSRGFSELSRVQNYHIDWDRRVICLTSYKGYKRTREVPMTEIAYRAIAWWYHEGRALPNESRWRKFWKSVAKDGVKPYSLRHTFCTRMLDRGVPIPVVQQIMGHSNMEMTMRYYHIRESAIEAARKALE